MFTLRTLASAVTGVEVNEVPCTLLSMNFFDRLQSNGTCMSDSSYIELPLLIKGLHYTERLPLCFCAKLQAIASTIIIIRRDCQEEWLHCQVL